MLERELRQEGGIVPESSATSVSPTSESGAGTPPNLLTHILREWPDAAARVTIVAVAGVLFWLTWAHWGDISWTMGLSCTYPWRSCVVSCCTATYIVLTNRYTGEHGPAYFGIDYDRKVYVWIEANYRVAGQFSDFRRGRSCS